LTSHHQHKALTDEELLAQYRQTGDNQWLGHALERYTLLLLGVAMKYLKDKEQAQDAVQQIFLKALIHLPQGEILNFKGWLYVLMRNYCLQQLRDKPFHAPEEALDRLTEEAGDSREEIAWKNYTLEQMTETLKDLNQEQRVSLELFYLQKKSYEQIMGQTGFSFMQVKSYIQNGKRNLKLMLLKKLGNRQS
jgi:RNA polymerase sigma factor (sigma-70 family)